jgi:hypothetical protein
LRCSHTFSTAGSTQETALAMGRAAIAKVEHSPDQSINGLKIAAPKD